MKKTIIIIAILSLFISGCSQKDSPNTSTEISSAQESNFLGEKGTFLALEENGIKIEANSIDDGEAHFFNTTLPDGDPIYFFIVKSPDGKLRAAANGCQVCGNALQGFRQEGDFMVCNTCGNQYPLNKVATEKGGCNPAPINPDLEIVDGFIQIPISELETVQQHFL